MGADVRQVVAAAVVAVTALTFAGCAQPVGVPGAGGAVQPSTVAPAPSAAPPSTLPPPSTSPTASPTPSASLRPGDTGPAVLALQQHLVQLGFWLGTPDGTYGASTTHAVAALQKVHRLGRDGVAGPQTLRALEAASRPVPRSRAGRVVEVDLARQVLFVAVDGHTVWLFDASTGARAGTTPTGHYQVFRQVDGYDRGPLGTLYRPKYFYRGVAVHGYPNVPPYPASHGCVRVTNAAMDWLWSSGTLPIGQQIWVY